MAAGERIKIVIELSYDEQTGLIISVSFGLLTVEEIRRSHKEIRSIMGRARAKFGRANYMVDARNSPIQPRDVMAEAERLGSFLEHPSDRMAIVVSSALAKMQSRRALDAQTAYPQNGEVFLSEDEARTWLLQA